MKDWQVLFTTILLAALTGGCVTTAETLKTRSAVKEITPTISKSVSITGEWEGTSISAGGLHNRIVLRLTQNGETVHGSYDFYASFTNSPLDEPIEGTLRGNVLSLRIPRFAFGRIEAVVTDGKIEGTYLGGSGILGRFTATKAR